jgi:cytochrome P450
MTQYTVENFTSQEFKRNPHPIFEELRDSQPLFKFALPNSINAWMVTRYEDVQEILKDNTRFTKDRLAVFSPEAALLATPPAMQLFNRHMLLTDPPDHSRLRNLVSKAFTPRVIEQLRPRIQQITDELLDAVQAQGRMELIGDFAFPLPITVIFELLGIPLEDRDRVRVWTNALFNTPAGFFQSTSSATEIQEFADYLQDLIVQRRAHPTDDMIGRLVQTEEEGDRLSEKELVSMLFLLIVAGHETTVNLIGNGSLALLQHPDQMRLLQEHPEYIESAVEELLRFTSPVMAGTARWCRVDMEFHGQPLHKGDFVFLSLMSANSDPQHFHDPEKLDITREERQHVAFGKGIHFCLGAPLARLEGQIAFSTLLSRLPDLRLAADPEQLPWRPNLILRGLNTLPVTF